MRDQSFEIGQYEVFYSAARIGHVVAKKTGGPGVTIINVFWRGDDRGFTSAKAEAERLHADDMLVNRLEHERVEKAGTV